MCLPFTKIFNYFYNNCYDYKSKLSKEEIYIKRAQMLPFAWKYKITPKEQMKENIIKTEILVTKSEELACSSKQFRDLTKQLTSKIT